LVVDLEDYSLARVIKGIYDSEYKTIATDSDGNIIGVFKGEYNNELITIKTDSTGRMLAIVTDPEDVYGNVHMVGNAELAARLGSIVTFERNGEVLWLEDFEGPTVNWDSSLSSPGSIVGLTTKTRRTGSQSLLMTTASEIGDYAYIRRILPRPVLGKIGFELSFTLDSGTKYIELDVTIYDGTYYYSIGVRYDLPNTRIEIRNSAGGWESYQTDISLDKNDYYFHTIKIVADLSSLSYVRLILNDVEYDMSSEEMYRTESETVSKTYIVLRHQTATATAETAYLDDFIVTQNEQ